MIRQNISPVFFAGFFVFNLRFSAFKITKAIFGLKMPLNFKVTQNSVIQSYT